MPTDFVNSKQFHLKDLFQYRDPFTEVKKTVIVFKNRYCCLNCPGMVKDSQIWKNYFRQIKLNRIFQLRF